MNTTQEGIVTLLRAGITGEALTLPADFSLEEAAKIAVKQSAGQIFYQGALTCGVSQEMPVMKQLLTHYYKRMIIHERQMRAIQEIFAVFEANGIDYMPMKGCELKALYPKPELRAMSDADILIRAEDHPRILPLMEELGYTFQREDDHVFMWSSKVLHVELHKFLAPPADEDYHAYYGTGWRRARKQAGCHYAMSPEDTYLFLFTHFARHYRFGGIGCRHAVDLFVYRRAFADLDESYLKAELRKLHLLEFHAHVERMLDVWFHGGEPDEITELITAFVFSGGSWGTMETMMFAQEIKAAARAGRVKRSGLRSMLRAIFPPVSQLSYRYALIRKSPVFLPVVWVARWIDILFFRPQKIRKRVRILRTVSDDAVRSRAEALAAVGLGFHFDR